MEQIIFRARPGARLSVRGDVVQDLIVAELGQFGWIGEMLGVALRNGYLQAADTSFVDHITLMLQDRISKLATVARHDMRHDGMSANRPRRA